GPARDLEFTHRKAFAPLVVRAVDTLLLNDADDFAAIVEKRDVDVHRKESETFQFPALALESPVDTRPRDDHPREDSPRHPERRAESRTCGSRTCGSRTMWMSESSNLKLRLRLSACRVYHLYVSFR